MALITRTHKEYYEGADFGNYQFTSLEDIITHFEIAYVGENKIIPRVKTMDIAFHAQRALQELSFDTFKSIKSQQIDLPPTLVMPLPHDYVNYTKLSYVDSSGIKHPLYSTKDTSNPFQIRQEDDGSYSFPTESEEVVDGDFSIGDFKEWQVSNDITTYTTKEITSGTSQGVLFSHASRAGYYAGGNFWGYTNFIFQRLDVADKEYVDISATGKAVETIGGAAGVLRVGLSTSPPDANNMDIYSTTSSIFVQTQNSNTSIFNLKNEDNDASYIEWNSSVDGASATSKEVVGINVTGVDTVYIIAVSFNDFSQTAGTPKESLQPTNSVDNISVIDTYASNSLQTPIGNRENSSTWENYKSTTPSENNNDDYEDDNYWPMQGERYGLDPQHAQVNGSFYIDQRLGRIHFSSNISGKTVILDYISDSLGTHAEMQVHKFAEEAMYKCIAYAILSTSSMPIHQQLAPRFKKERFAAIRQAKLRLSSVKLEELTQVLRGKSKQIKH